MVASTDAFIIYANGRRDKKVSEHYSYFPTKLEALTAIKERLELERSRAAETVREATDNLALVVEAIEQEGK